MLYPVKSIIDDQPTFEVPLGEILAGLKADGALQVLSPDDFHTERQRKWYKGVCIPNLVKNDENGETKAWWDLEVKRQCNGLKYLKKEIFLLDNGLSIGRLTIRGVSKRKMTDFIEEIISKSIELGWCVPPPDSDLRRDK